MGSLPSAAPLSSYLPQKTKVLKLGIDGVARALRRAASRAVLLSRDMAMSDAAGQFLRQGSGDIVLEDSQSSQVERDPDVITLEATSYYSPQTSGDIVLDDLTTDSLIRRGSGHIVLDESGDFDTRVARPAAQQRRGSRHRGKPWECSSIIKGEEYAKHAVYRRANGLTSAKGAWRHSAALALVTLPPLTPRERDCVDIIYLCFEARGVDPTGVDQVWSIDQSIIRRKYRGERLRKRNCVGRRLCVPGLNLADTSQTLAPCMLPQARLWINRYKRLMSGAEMLQLNGLPLSSCPHWRVEDDSTLARAAGNAFSMTVAAAHVVTAVGRLVGRFEKITDVTFPAKLPDLFSLPAVASFYNDRLLKLCPTCFAASSPEATVTIGTLCSGTDGVTSVAQAVGEDLTQRALPRVSAVHKFRCEFDSRMRDFSARNAPACQACHDDVMTLPLADMPAVDLLIFGSSCKGLSSVNNDRRTLADIDPTDRRCSSGNTMHGCLAYVETCKPSIVIIENVLGMLSRSRRLATSENCARNVDFLLAKLRALGYVCGYNVVSCHEFLLPQRRWRTYVWAELETRVGVGCHPSEVWSRLIPAMRSAVAFPLDACLL